MNQLKEKKFDVLHPVGIELGNTVGQLVGT
jgi:hypothetical protein